MQIFTVEPYIGPAPIRFGMTQKEVEAVLGKPQRRYTNFFGDPAAVYPNLQLGFPKDRLDETIFVPGSTLLFERHDLFREADPIGFLTKYDDTPYEWVGFVVFLKLGISVDLEDSGAIQLHDKAHYDKYREKIVKSPYRAKSV